MNSKEGSAWGDKGVCPEKIQERKVYMIHVKFICLFFRQVTEGIAEIESVIGILSYLIFWD